MKQRSRRLFAVLAVSALATLSSCGILPCLTDQEGVTYVFVERHEGVESMRFNWGQSPLNLGARKETEAAAPEEFLAGLYPSRKYGPPDYEEGGPHVSDLENSSAVVSWTTKTGASHSVTLDLRKALKGRTLHSRGIRFEVRAGGVVVRYGKPDVFGTYNYNHGRCNSALKYDDILIRADAGTAPTR